MRLARILCALCAVLLLALCCSPVATAGCGGGRAGFGLFGHRHRAVVVEGYACPVAYPAAAYYVPAATVTYQPAATYHQPVIYSTPGYYQQPAQILGPPLPSLAPANCPGGVCPVR